MSRKSKKIKRRAGRRPPASGRKPADRIGTQDVAVCAEELQMFHRQYESLFVRCEQREASWLYLCGQLSGVERKTIEPIVLGLCGLQSNVVRAVQGFIGSGQWDVDQLIHRHQAKVAVSLGDPRGVVIVDSSGFPKQGQHSAGVAYQYCGALGKVANCQEGVFVVYASAQGATFLNGRNLAAWTARG